MRFIFIFMFLIVFSLGAQDLQEELKIWELPVKIEKIDEGYKIIDSESTNFTEASYSISYLMTSLEFVIDDNNIKPNFQVEYIFIDDDGKMWNLHISKMWLNNYLNCDSKSIKEDMIRRLILPYTEEQRTQQSRQLEDKIRSLR